MNPLAYRQAAYRVALVCVLATALSGAGPGGAPRMPARALAPVYPSPGAYDPGRRPTLVDPTWPALPRPGAGDWLAQFHEAGQTFDEYVASGPLRPTAQRRTLAVIPLGDIAHTHPPLLDAVSRHLCIYFGLPSVVAAGMELPRPAYHHRRQGDQYDGDAVLGWLKVRLPAGALALAAITDQDLFSDGLNFVFGLAWSADRVSVHSIARYGPDDAAHSTVVLRRTLQTSAHEMGHVLGLDHCVFYACCMNGANTLEESDRTPIHLCPECARKVAYATGVDRRRRDVDLCAFYRSVGLIADADFLARRLATRGPGR